MPPATEPSPADVAAVDAHLNNQPAPVATPPATPQATPAPAQQPAQPTPQPAPTSQPAGDPFESLFATPPATPPAAPPTTPPATPPPSQPTEPVPTPQPQQPVETPQPTPAPGTVVEPTATPPEDNYETYEDYMKSVVGDLDTAPQLPDHSKIAPDDEAGIKNFFDDLVNTAVARAKQETARTNAIQVKERTLWDAAFDKYGSLRTNKNLRDMVHNIRMGHFQKGIAITPTQAADKLLDALKAEHQRGVADNTVVTTIESTQPQGGGSGQPVPTTLDKETVLTAVQTGGETALASYLDTEIKAGRM